MDELLITSDKDVISIAKGTNESDDVQPHQGIISICNECLV